MIAETVPDFPYIFCVKFPRHATGKAEIIAHEEEIASLIKTKNSARTSIWPRGGIGFAIALPDAIGICGIFPTTRGIIRWAKIGSIDTADSARFLYE